ncbi:hypothetical protein [Frankia sp. CiP3]|uniref:hypothetical protein n=1 Tax=Frankia sp. CiP3 TaxID=2880971 RepID=UPI001EF423C9|nr:hypothetical protein [Frankia sp. CiP3]
MGIHAGQHVVFDFDGALELARQLWRLADDTERQEGVRVTAARTALADWQGGYAVDFAESMNAETTSASTVAAHLRNDARILAQQWVRAMDEEGRVRHAEHVERLKAQRSLWEHVEDFFIGDDHDYGNLPATPLEPQPPLFDPTAVLPHYQ